MLCTLGTYAGAGRFTIGMDWEHNSPVESTENEQNVDYCITAFRTQLLEVITIRNAYLFQNVHTPTEPGIGPGEFRSIGQNLKGLRPIPAGAIAMPLNMCLLYSKIVTKGHSGRLELRGCLHSDDILRDATGDYTLKLDAPSAGNPEGLPVEFDDFQKGFIANLPNGRFVVPDSPTNVLDYSRGIVRLANPLVHSRQVSQKKVSTDRAFINATRRKVEGLKDELFKTDLSLGDLKNTAVWVLRKEAILEEITKLLLELPILEAAKITAHELARAALYANKVT